MAGSIRRRRSRSFCRPSADEIIQRLSGLEDAELTREIGVRSLVFAEDGLRVIFDELLAIADLDQTLFTA